MARMAYDVFISHSSQDKMTADAVCAILEASGIRCWIAPRDVALGSDWTESIVDAIEACPIMVLVFSKSANDSHQIKREVNLAIDSGRTVIPIRVEDVVPSKSLKFSININHWLDAFPPPLENHLKTLVRSIQALLPNTPGRGPVETPALVLEENPPAEIAAAPVPPPAPLPLPPLPTYATQSRPSYPPPATPRPVPAPPSVAPAREARSLPNVSGVTSAEVPQSWVSRFCYGLLWVTLADIVCVGAAMVFSGINDVDKMPQGYLLLPGIIVIAVIVLAIRGKLPRTGRFRSSEWFAQRAKTTR
jgi:hypothetical protein